jgi:hypothetical protein
MNLSRILTRQKLAVSSWIKHQAGPTLDQRLLAICVDDYGNIRLKSNKAKELMASRGLRPFNIFDEFDCLETTDDLSAILETLCSLKDSNSDHAKLTALACPCNISFEKMRQSRFEVFEYELLPQTYARLGPQYDGNCALWEEAASKRLIRAEFHGREHLNIRIIMAKLRSGSPDIAACIEADSLARLRPLPNVKTSWTAAFGSHEPTEVEEYKQIIRDGVSKFNIVFGRHPRVFNAPGSSESDYLHEFLRTSGFEVVETPFFQWQRRAFGLRLPKVNVMRQASERLPAYSVRNCVFEPNSPRGFDWCEFTLRQVEDAFAFKKPAIISTHRVNFCGGISEQNRENGLGCLRKLLSMITRKWPDVQFVFLDELAERIGLLATPPK